MRCLPQPGPGSQFAPKYLQQPETFWKNRTQPLAALFSSREGRAVNGWQWSLLSAGGGADRRHGGGRKLSGINSQSLKHWLNWLVRFPRHLPAGDVQGEGSILEEVRLAAAPVLLLVQLMKMGKHMLKSTVRSQCSLMNASFSFSSRNSPIIHRRCSMWLKTPTHWAAAPQVSDLNSLRFFTSFHL